MANTRLKDYFDLSVLLQRETLDTDLLAQAIKATFERRGMPVPDTVPTGLTDEFAHDSSRQSLWLAFLKKNDIPPRAAACHRGTVEVCPGPSAEPSVRWTRVQQLRCYGDDRNKWICSH